MSTTLNIGDDANAANDDIVELAFEDGDQPTVKNNGPNTVNYYIGDVSDEGAADGTISSGSSHQFTGPPAYLTAAGVTSITITSSAAAGAYGP